jgi:transposase-like protein
MNLTDPIFTDERKAREHFEAALWPDGPVCPHCGCLDRVYRLNGTKHREGLVYCNNCNGSFTVMTGTVMESSHVPLTKWALAYRLMASAKKGISAHQMHRTLGVTYRTAWFMCHRIRESMRDVTGDKLGGPGKIVEADEVFIGGKPRKGQAGRTRKDDHKVPVAVLVERGPGGRSRAVPIAKPMGGALKRNIAVTVAQGTDIHSDDHKAYRGVEKITGGKHAAVKHMIGEYARTTETGTVHNNTAESWNALLERSIVGAFHHVSPEHLSRYCDEVSFRWDRRGMDDTERAIDAVRGAEGKRLTYRRTRGGQAPSA